MDSCGLWLQAGGVLADVGVGILTYFALKEAIKANKTAKKANDVANEANEIANTANIYTRAEINQSIDAMLQTKNIELFEKRLGLIKAIEKFELSSQMLSMDNLTFDIRLELELLFRNDRDIMKQFDDLKETMSLYINNNYDIKHWEDETPSEIVNTIQNLEADYEKYSYDTIKKRYLKMCKEHYVPWDDGDGETKKLYYNKLSQRSDQLSTEFNDIKQRLITMMKTFISTSIEDYNEKKVMNNEV